MKRILFSAAALIVSGAALIPASASAQHDVRVVAGHAPPPPRYEPMPAARRGHEWVPGHWAWNGRRHVWSRGHWERVRPGHAYRHPTWQHANDGWHYQRGGWHRVEQRSRAPVHSGYDDGVRGYADRDRDGVPNRVDRDRDGDGVANRYDSDPGNPRRY